MIFEKPAWVILHFVKEDVVCTSGIDLPGNDIGGNTHDITTPGGSGGITGPVVPLP